ncbi:MAG: hypothetical protein ABIG32_01045 [Candidatus Uhrbacteria bacterium]|nr:hypothetical protein [Patescibacteria group bacterium]MBU1706025.1 hypothetical protein [Patescibacteria group bacterium]MBU1906897.1 hypothetical protein [Patescibacteria group bacterium]
MRTFAMTLIVLSLLCGAVPAKAQSVKNPDEIALEELMQVKHDVRAACEADNGTLDRFDFESISHSSFPTGKAFLTTSACCMPEGMHSCYPEVRLVLYDNVQIHVVDISAMSQDPNELRLMNGKLVIVERSDNIVNRNAVTTCEYTEVVWDDINKRLTSVNVWRKNYDAFSYAQSCP